MVDKNDILVIKHNSLIEAGYKLTVNEQRLLLLAIGQLKPKVPMGAQKTQEISVQDFMAMYGVSQKNAYSQLSQAADKLFEQEIQTYDEEGKERMRWVSKAKYDKKGKFVRITFTDEVKPYLTFLSNGKYTQYNLVSLAGAKSHYAIRLYEMLKVWRTRDYRYIYIDDLRKWLALGDKYKRYYNLKVRVIEPAIKDINDNTDLEVDWEEIKKGREVVKINFIFASEKQITMF